MQSLSHSVTHGFTRNLWWPRLGAFVLAGLAAASAAYWVLKWPGASSASANLPNTLPAALADATATDPQALARALGGGAAAASDKPGPVVASVASRFMLVGVVANNRQGGTALIAVDGKPARPYRVGATVEDGLVLQSVGARQAQLGASGVTSGGITLELPALKK